MPPWFAAAVVNLTTLEPTLTALNRPDGQRPEADLPPG